MTGTRRLNYENYTFKQLMELDACTRCGECIAWCPTYTEKENDAITPLGKIEQVRRFASREYGLWASLFGPRSISDESLSAHSAGAYDCTLCARCHEVCPVGIDTRPLWISMREQLVEAGVYPEPMARMRSSVLEQHNNLGESNDSRSAWAANLDTQPHVLQAGAKADLVYFVGCVSALFPMAYSIPQSLAQILDKVGIPFATLGSEEWCCGFPLIIAGMGSDVEDTVRHNVQAVRESGAGRLVVTCPSCFHTWKDTYPEIMGEPLGFEVIHAVELLDELIDDGKLVPGSYENQVTYHDPCDLGRTSGIYDVPRRVLRSIPGIRFHEMVDHHERALCCGGGGDVEMADPDLTASVAQRRLQQAKDVEAEVIATACQQCKRTLLGAARKAKTRIRTLDITEIMWEAIRE